MNIETKSITQEEFHFLLGTDAAGSHPLLHDEREWWKGNQRIGIIIFDKFDKDWSYAALAQNPEGKYQAFKTRVSLESIDAARVQLLSSFTDQLEPDWYK